MDSSATPPLDARTVPTKLAMAPTSSRPARRRAISAPTSKSSCWTRVWIAKAVVRPAEPASSTGSASGDGREERDFGAFAQGGGGVGQHLVDRDLDIAPLSQGLAPGLAAAAQPGAQLAGAGDAAGQADFFARQAERLAQGGEVDDRDVHADTSGFRPAANRAAGSAPCRRGGSRRPADCQPGRRPTRGT